MKLKYQEEPINYPGPDIANEYRRQQKMIITCELCGTTTIKYRINIKQPMICNSCAKKLTFNGKDWTDRNNKSQKTKLERYGDAHYVNPQKISQSLNNRSNELKEETKEKTKQTNLEKYGGHPACRDIQKEKTKQTCLKKYGVDSVFKVNEFKEKQQETCLEKYGVDNVFKSDIIKEKIKQTCLERYGVNNPRLNNNIDEKIKQTCLERYGVNHPWKNHDVRVKCQQTCLEKYGEIHYSKTDEFKELCKQICLNRYGVDSYFKLDWVKEKSRSKETLNKIFLTKKRNGTFNKSQPEDECYNILKEHYPDIIRQYREKRYPFNCDFYIPSKDLFIEYQGAHYHQNHPFNENDENDIKILEQLKEKADKSPRHKEGKKSQYDIMIYVWTDLDIRKRTIAKENNLNFIEIWNLDELKLKIF